ncbi:molybdopterin-containing oxidoreductase family protein [Desulfitobacterium dehalogenans]|uniref:molybdopterin-containing oxidoreductase family protein n=1 Tax=Desulfitobacterium dehalogenans TaxID=36854 RepID=UPI00130519C9|nr:molybdopterin-dependent oxidoreductase [Desulfitobacterium dehalogenans]
MNDTTQVIIVDATDYGVDYAAFFAELRQRSPGIAVVALLADSSRAYRQHMLSGGADAALAIERADELLAAAVWHSARKNTSVFASNDCVEQAKEGIQNVKEDLKLFERQFNRRAFLKGSAAAAAVTGVTVASPGKMATKALAAGDGTASVKQEQIFYGACRANCFGGCRLKITVRNGKVVKTQMAEVPDKRYNRVCARGLTHTQMMYSPDRLKHPLKRVGERGAGQWEQITWEEAIKTITDTWKKIRTELGNNSIGFSHGTGSNGVLTNNGFHRLRNLMEATCFYCNYDSNHIVTIGQCLGIGPNYNGNEMADLINAKTIIFFGANITESQPQNWHFVKEAQENGTKLICIDPVSTTLAIRSDIHVPIRPGTDAALAMAMMNIIIKNGWTDDTFIKKSSVGPFLVKESDGTYLRFSDLWPLPEGEQDAIVVRDKDGNIGVPGRIPDPVIKGSYTVNGIKVTTAFDLLVNRVAEWTPERTAELCDIPVDQLHEITRIYATETPSTIFTGFGPDHYVNGNHAYVAIFALGMITGNIGKPGASTGWPFNLGFNINAGAISTAPGSPIGPTLPQVKIPYIVENKQYGGKPLELRSIYHVNTNPLGNFAGRQELLQAYEKLELIVASDWRLTDTARYADIVLPAAHWFEVEDIHSSGQTTWTAFQEKAVEPPFECKSDWEMIRMLAEAMGYGEHCSYTDSEMLRMACEGPGPEAFGISYDKLKSEKVVRGALPPGKTYLYGEDGVFKTATGRVQFYFENPQPDYLYDPVNQKINPDEERLPYFEPPREAWPETVGSFTRKPLAEKYPLVYTSERNKLKTHTMFGHNPWLLELYPEPIVKVNPQDARQRGIADGDYAKVYNDRGYVVLKVVFSSGVRPGMLVVPKGWQADQFKEGHYSDLVGNLVDDYRLNNNYFDTLCEMEKV